MQFLGLDSVPEKGVVSETGTDWIDYQAGDYSTGTDTFSYTVKDSAGNSTTQTITVTLTGTNDAPTITGGTTSGAVGEDGTLSASGTLTATDVDNGATQAWSVQGGGSGAYGSLSVNGSGGWNYALANGSSAVQALAAGQSVSDSFTVEVSDGNGGTDTEVVNVTIAGANEAAPTGNLLVNFEDMPDGTYLPQGYKGFNWNSPQGINGFVHGGTGGINVTSQVNQSPGTDWIWSNGGTSPFIVTRSDGADFDFVGTWAANNGTQLMSVRGYDDGQLVASINVSVGSAVYIPANFVSIDRLEFHSGGNFAFDNMLFSI